VPGGAAAVIMHNLPLGLNWLEVPRGPLFESEDGLKAILSEITKLGRHHKSVFIRLSAYEQLKIDNLRLKIAKHDHNPETSLVLDLRQSEDELLAQMKPKGRYNIRLAEKHGVTIRESSSVDEFYGLLTKTSNRDGFAVHPKAYYEKMLKSLGAHAQLLEALHAGRVIAGGIFVYLDDWGIYYYGASASEHRNLMAPYLVQWHAILEAKKRGCGHYDFLGIAPEGAKNHPWAGVTEFKEKFGGERVKYPKARDLVLRPVWYWIYRLAKSNP
jgi:lipid II:glycine glycyltransferase (peptidoglycan interpeptide bridge formation enzyme)